MKDYDVVIVGAGPAGVACALTLAKHNLEVALVEKRAFPVVKACGESILPMGVAHLKKLGILERIKPEHYHPTEGICYHINHHSSKANFIDGYGLGINRSILSQAFSAAINDYPSITMFDHTAIKDIDFPFLTFMHKEKLFHCSSNFVVGADGLRSRVREILGIKTKLPHFRRWAMTAHFGVEPWSSLVEIYLHNNAEAYVSPTGPKEVNIVLMWSPKKYSVKTKSPFFSLLSLFPELEKRLNPPFMLHKAHAIGPFHHRAKRRFTTLQAALIGDAAGYTDPLTGEGINYGLFEGQLLGQKLASRLAAGQSMSQNDLRYFQLVANLKKLPHEMLTYGMLLMQSQPALFERVVHYFNRKPNVLSALTGISAGSSLREIFRTLNIESATLR